MHLIELGYQMDEYVEVVQFYDRETSDRFDLETHYYLESMDYFTALVF